MKRLVFCVTLLAVGAASAYTNTTLNISAGGGTLVSDNYVSIGSFSPLAGEVSRSAAFNNQSGFIVPSDQPVVLLYQLTVNGGTGGGSYTNRARVKLAATVPAGWKFDHWNDGNTNASRIITMTTADAVYTASLKDAQNPVLTVSSPANGIRLISEAVTVAGKATDNNGAADVLIQFNAGTWVTNNTLLSTTNWTASLTLQPGANTVKIYARDAAGNSSATNTLNLTYVLYGTLTVRTDGLGTVNRAPTGTPEVGATYTLTAVPGAGYGFKEWTDGSGSPVGINKVLVFSMSPYKVYQANFTDIQKPTVVIKAPVAKTTNGLLTVRGTATDNKAVASVWVQVSSNGWTQASGTNSWTGTVNLAAGLNTIRAYSMDAAGNCSLTSSVTCTYVVIGNLTIQTNGVGTVTRAPTGKPEIGKLYTLTAAAGTGSVFANWTGDHTSTNRVIKFTMASNMTFTANFTDTAKPTVAIKTPTALQKIFGATGNFTVTGTALDNLALSNVMVSVNSGPFVPASPASTNGLKTWVLPVTLLVSNNTIAAYSEDTTGNRSATITVKCVYTETGALNITTNGPGKVTVAPAGPLLLNKTYTLTAAANAGGVFSNWTGDVVIGSPTGKVVKITLDDANKTKTVTANFADNVKPTIKITAPAARTNTSLLTVQGVATDNKAVASVWVRVNSNAWTQATGTNSWNLPVTLDAGPNTIRAYSVDTTGNNSLTSSVVCTYVVSGSLTITTNGLGKVARTPTTPVEIGQTYTLTATPGTGYGLQSWGGDASGTNKVVKVKATSNTTVIANFADNVNPVVTIADPKAGQRVSNSVHIVKGTATDNFGVSNVLCRVNGGEWTNAVTTNGWKTWSVPVELRSGSNLVQACSIDAARNSSTFANISCTYVVTGPLTLVVTGNGTVTPNLDGQMLEMGKRYTMTAKPATGAIFVDWTYGVDGAVATNKPAVTFPMQSNLVLTANFTTLLNLSEEGLDALSELLDTNSIPQGNAQLIADAALAFDLAARSSPNNYTNRIYNAVTIIMNLINNPAVRSQAEAYGVNLDNLLDPTCIFPTNAPSVDASVDQFAAVVFPAIDKAWAELNAGPATWAGRVEISTNRFSSFDESVWVDVGDVAALKAALKGLRAFTGVLKAYNLNVNFARIYDPVATPQKAITVDGSVADWANVPRSLLTFDYEDGMGTAFAVTQEVAVLLDGTNVALLVTGCPFDIRDNFSLFFDLRLYADGDAFNSENIRYPSVDLYSSGGVVYGMMDGLVIDGFETALVDGVMEIRFPVADGLPVSQVTVTELGGGMVMDEWWEEIFWIEPPGDTPISVLRANHPEFFSKVRNQTSLTAAKTDLQAALNGYLAADTLIGKRSGADAALLHLVDFDPLDEEAQEDRAEKRDVVSKIIASLTSSAQLPAEEDIEGTLTRPVFLGAFFNGKITTNMLPLGLKGTLNNPDWTVFPDPTLNGLLPGMTATNLNKYLRGEYAWMSIQTVRDFTPSSESPYQIDVRLGLDRVRKTVVNATVSGLGPLEQWGDNDEWGWSFEVATPPAAGTKYTLKVEYADGSTEIVYDKINAWIAVNPKPVLTGTKLSWASGAAVPNAECYNVYTSYGDWEELPLTQTFIDLSEFGYVAGDPCWFEVRIVNKNWDKASRRIDTVE